MNDKQITNLLSSVMIALLAFSLGFATALTLASHQLRVEHALNLCK